MAHFRISRNKGLYGRARALKIIADGDVVGKIKAGETLDIEISSDTRQIWGKMDWGKTNKLSLSDLSGGEELQFRGWLTFNLLHNLGYPQIPIELEIADQSFEDKLT